MLSTVRRLKSRAGQLVWLRKLPVSDKGSWFGFLGERSAYLLGSVLIAQANLAGSTKGTRQA